MSIKLKIINKSIKYCEKRLKKLDAIFDFEPMLRLLEIRKDALGILKTHDGDYKKISELIKPLRIEEKKMVKMARYKNKNYIKLMDEQHELRFELEQLKTERYIQRGDFKRWVKS